MPGIRLLTTGFALVASLVMLTIVTDVVVDWAWFSDLGYRDVFRTMLATKASVFLVVFTVTTAVLGTNGWLAFRLGGPPKRVQSLRAAGDAPWGAPSGGLDRAAQHVRGALMPGVCAPGLLVALFERSQWDLA